MRLALLLVFMLTGCVSFRSKGVDEPMADRVERICKETDGRFVNGQCDYSKSPQADTTVAMLGLQT